MKKKLYSLMCFLLFIFHNNYLSEEIKLNNSFYNFVKHNKTSLFYLTLGSGGLIASHFFSTPNKFAQYAGRIALGGIMLYASFNLSAGPNSEKITHGEKCLLMILIGGTILTHFIDDISHLNTIKCLKNKITLSAIDLLLSLCILNRNYKFRVNHMAEKLKSINEKYMETTKAFQTEIKSTQSNRIRELLGEQHEMKNYKTFKTEIETYYTNAINQEKDYIELQINNLIEQINSYNPIKKEPCYYVFSDEKFIQIINKEINDHRSSEIQKVKDLGELQLKNLSEQIKAYKKTIQNDYTCSDDTFQMYILHQFYPIEKEINKQKAILTKKITNKESYDIDKFMYNEKDIENQITLIWTQTQAKKTHSIITKKEAIEGIEKIYNEESQKITEYIKYIEENYIKRKCNELCLKAEEENKCYIKIKTDFLEEINKDTIIKLNDINILLGRYKTESIESIIDKHRNALISNFLKGTAQSFKQTYSQYLSVITKKYEEIEKVNEKYNKTIEIISSFHKKLFNYFLYQEGESSAEGIRIPFSAYENQAYRTVKDQYNNNMELIKKHLESELLKKYNLLISHINDKKTYDINDIELKFPKLNEKFEYTLELATFMNNLENQEANFEVFMNNLNTEIENIKQKEIISLKEKFNKISETFACEIINESCIKSKFNFTELSNFENRLQPYKKELIKRIDEQCIKLKDKIAKIQSQFLNNINEWKDINWENKNIFNVFTPISKFKDNQIELIIRELIVPIKMEKKKS